MQGQGIVNQGMLFSWFLRCCEGMEDWEYSGRTCCFIQAQEQDTRSEVRERYMFTCRVMQGLKNCRIGPLLRKVHQVGGGISYHLSVAGWCGCFEIEIRQNFCPAMAMACLELDLGLLGIRSSRATTNGHWSANGLRFRP